MIRILTVAAVAALVAAPASAQSARISTAGKTADELHAAISAAAKKVCRQATVSASFPYEMYKSCYRHAVKQAVNTVGSPELAQAAGLQVAEAR